MKRGKPARNEPEMGVQASAVERDSARRMLDTVLDKPDRHPTFGQLAMESDAFRQPPWHQFKEHTAGSSVAVAERQHSQKIMPMTDFARLHSSHEATCGIPSRLSAGKSPRAKTWSAVSPPLSQ
jgi:hypothetical protein